MLPISTIASLVAATAQRRGRGHSLRLTRTLPSKEAFFLHETSLPLLKASTVLEVTDYSRVAIDFLQSIRIPAALIAGSSLGAFFIMVKRMSQPEQEKSKRQLLLLFLYHALSLFALLLSLNVIVTATSASNTLLIGHMNTMATSGYDLLMRELPYEYISTRWSFYASIICFLKAIACRALLEFNLVRIKRVRSALLVIFSMTGLITHILHIINNFLYTYPNFWEMTFGMFRLYLTRMQQLHSPMLRVSFACLLATGVTFCTLIPRLFDYASEGAKKTDRNNDTYKL